MAYFGSPLSFDLVNIVLHRAIGIFDSGVGGLTVLKEILQLLPNEDLLYLGDTARVPYGTKSAATVQQYALESVSNMR